MCSSDLKRVPLGIVVVAWDVAWLVAPVAGVVWAVVWAVLLPTVGVPGRVRATPACVAEAGVAVWEVAWDVAWDADWGAV